MYLNLQGALEITYMVSTQQNLTLYLSKSSATIKQHISTPLVHPLIVTVPKHVLVPHRAHSFIVNVQPNFPATAISARVQHVDCIVPACCRLAMMVKHPIELVAHRLRKFPGNRCHDFWTDSARNDSQPWLAWGKRSKNPYLVGFRAQAQTE